VSLQDYSDLALSVANVGKANAVSEIWTSVTLYVAPVRNVNDLDVYPGKTIDNLNLTDEWETIQRNTQNFFEGKTLLGSTLTVAPPVYVPVVVKVVFTKNDQFTAQQTEDEIKQTIINLFSYPYLEFGQVITPSQVSTVVNNIRSVKTATVTALYKVGTPEVLAALVGGPSEIFVFQEAETIITESSNNADLSALTSSAGTLVPAFSATQYSYNITGVTGNITLTPTGVGKTTRVNGVIVASGTASSSITIPVGITEVLVTVTAADGFTSKVYTINVSRAS
jgi:hypothetical protein